MWQDAKLEFKQSRQFIVVALFVALVFISLPVNAAKTASSGSKVTLNFNATDINAVISAVSEMTGRNFIVDPRVKGKVTVISHRALKSSEIYQVFLSVLKVHGFAAIPGNNVTKIVPEVNAKQDAIRTGRQSIPISDEFITQVLEIKNVDAAQLVPILRPLVPQRGHLAAYPGSNVLVISDSAANIRRLKKIISSIDQATGDEIEVVPLQHASASEVVRIIQQLSAKDPKKKKNNLIADDRTNSVLLGGNKASRLKVKALIAHLDTPVDVGGSTQVVYLRNAVAKDLVPVLTGVSKSVSKAKGKKKGAAASNISIQADENTNALVITAPPDIFRSLRSVIRRLDVRRAQVLVEAIIAEVSINSSQEFGIQWAADASGSNAVGLVSFGLGNPLTGLLSDPPSLGSGLNIGVGNLDGTNRVGALISALSSDGKSNILSTPSLLTLDNEEAEIVVADNVPFLTGSFSGTGSGGSNPSNPFQTIQREDVGLTLRITPQINEGNAIKLDVEHEISSVSSSAQAVDLITSKRSLKTNVIVDDGQMIVLGGLIKEDFQDNEQRVPLLGDIPLLGYFFRYNTTSKIKTNLMIFLQPTILKDAALTSSHTGDKYNFIRGQQLDLRKEGFVIADEEDSPLLGEVKQFMKLPLPYNETVTTEDGSKEATNTGIETPPTMMEQVNDEQPKSTDGGNQ